jgi:hypothetical protein
MNPENNSNEQNEKLKEMNYSPENDIFNKEEHVPLDGDGNPITNPNDRNEEMPYGLDIPGFEDDDNFEQINSQIPTKDESLHTEDITEDDLEEEN